MSRPRDRSSATGLLPLMEARPWKDGKTVTYRYHPVGAKPINLGTDKIAAIRRVLDLTGRRDTHGTLRWVWEQFSREETPRGKPITTGRWMKLAPGTRDDYRLAWKQIEPVLGDMLMTEIASTVVAKYVHVERADSPRRADIEKSLLSRLFGHAIKLGVCEHNGTIGVEPHGSEPRTEAPSVDVMERFLSWVERQTPQRRIVAQAARFAALTGSRRVEFLQMTVHRIDDAAGVIRLVRAKQRGAKSGEVVDVIAITPGLRKLLDEIAAQRDARGRDCTYLFPTRGGNAYSARGFKTLWQRCWAAAIEAQVISADDRFTFHDLRAYYATQHKARTGELPDLHKNPATTAAVYDRNKEVPRRAL